MAEIEEIMLEEESGPLYGAITRRRDGSYVIERWGRPYHVPCDWPEWSEIDAYAAEHADEVTDEPAPPEPTLAEIKAHKKAQIAAARYEAEIAGVTLDGVTVKTDRQSQALITGAALAASQDPAYTVIWKAAGGFVTLSAEQIIAAAQAVRAHVEACFSREAELSSAVDAAKSAKAVRAIEWSLTE